MPIAKIIIKGLRGFATDQDVRLAQPDGSAGSGLTVVVGPNNAGKSTVIEALRAFAGRQPPSFTQGRRNVSANDSVTITLELEDGQSRVLRSIEPSGSETRFDPSDILPGFPSIFSLQSRRAFEPYFGKQEQARSSYITNYLGLHAQRQNAIGGFESRLFHALQNKDAFNQVLQRVLNPVPDWTIDQADSGQYFLKFRNPHGAHSSEGVGEGIVSLFFLVDALYDSEPGGVIAIDEPELSLHPALQRRLSELLTDFAADRQIVVATHSPYFVNLRALENGATIVRAHKVDGHSILSQLQETTAGRIRGLLQNRNNPHIFGLKAQEVFFLEEHPILVEGQEDVIFFERVLESLGTSLPGHFFGWGVGGAGNMGTVAQVLRDLGFKKVVGILDADKTIEIDELNRDYPAYKFGNIPANDIRTKKARSAIAKVKGLLDDKNESVRVEYQQAVRKLFEDLNTYLGGQAATGLIKRSDSDDATACIAKEASA